VSPALIGLLGVIVGAAINGGLASLREWRTEKSNQQSAARLVGAELVKYHALALGARELRPDQLPQLQDSTPIVWQSNRAVLARGLESDDWDLVARAYAIVDALVSVLVFEPDGSLEGWRNGEARRLLDAMTEPAEKAALALGRFAGVKTEFLPPPPEVAR